MSSIVDPQVWGRYPEFRVTYAFTARKLDSFLEAELAARGVALDVPIALRIDGSAAMLKWHVVDGSELGPGAGHAEHARQCAAC